MAKKKKITRPRARNVSVRAGRGRKAKGRDLISNSLGRVLIPLFLIVFLLSAVGYLAFLGFRTAVRSDFFALRSVQITGNERTSADDIRRTVVSAAEKPGVWNADLGDIRAKIEKFPFVKTASVSMQLPNGIKVDVVERTPAAAVKLSYGEYLVDADGNLLAAVNPKAKEFPILLQGWDETKTEKAIPENLARLKTYRKMVEEWKQFDLESRVKEVNLANLKEPVAVIEDSGRPISVTLAKESFGRSLKVAIEAITGKGARVRSVDAGGVSPVIQYLEY